MARSELIPGIPDEAAGKILKLLSSVSPDGIILFGSRAVGNYREGSDVDIALKGAQLTLDDRSMINVKYPSLNLPWKLDIVIYSLIEEPLLKRHIDEAGVRL